jgi:SAM-dependent methyltransferase
MHIDILRTFSSILNNYQSSWGSVLEIGPCNSSNESLLFLPATINSPVRIGVDKAGPYKIDDITVLKEDAKALSFPNNTFDLVLCNSVLEHESKFWQVISEMKRVLKPGGLLMIGIPAFSSSAKHKAGPYSTTVLMFHAYPNDYYRFSIEAVREVFLSDLNDINIIEVMTPPRIIGWGIKPLIVD